MRAFGLMGLRGPAPTAEVLRLDGHADRALTAVPSGGGCGAPPPMPHWGPEAATRWATVDASPHAALFGPADWAELYWAVDAVDDAVWHSDWGRAEQARRRVEAVGLTTWRARAAARLDQGPSRPAAPLAGAAEACDDERLLAEIYGPGPE